MEKCAIFIDGGYTDALTKKWHYFPLDYLKFSNELCKIIGAELLRVYYYNCLPLVKKMYEVVCDKCKKQFEIHFEAEDEWKIYCEDCLKEKKISVNRPRYTKEQTEEDKERYRKKKKFYNKLKRYPRFEVKYGRLQIIGGELKQKGVDVLMSLDIIDKCFENHIQHAIIVAGDSDFIPAIRKAKD